MKRTYLFLLGLTLALALVACAAPSAEPSQTPDPASEGITLPSESTGIPDEVMSLLERYMDAYKNGTTESVCYMHFENEFTRTAYIDSGDKLIDYKIEATEKINDNLYCFTLMAKTQLMAFQFGDDYQRVYNFAAQIGDEWYYINGVSNIPPAVQDNLDISKYTNADENIVDPDDIIGKVETGTDPALPLEPTADMFGFEGLDAALFAGAYDAYFGQKWVASFEDFPRIVLPHINVLGTYEDGGITYYVCDVMYKVHYYDEETKQFDDNAGSLGTPYRIGLIDKGDGTYDVKNGLMPPNGEQYGSVMKEVFGPLDELYQQYTSDNADTLEPIRVFPSSDELWEMYLKASNI